MEDRRMTFEQYIVNPMGRSNAILSSSVREIMKKDYTRRFSNVLLRENGKINYAIYAAKGAVYFVHIKIPSEVVKDFYYDVVLKFKGTTGLAGSMARLDKYEVQFFSNDPAFVFNYAHVFRKNDMFIDELKSKMSKQAIKKPPKETNPNELVGYVKSLYFAYLFMQQRGLFNPSHLASATPFDIKYMLSIIEDADSKIAKRQAEGAKISKHKKTEVSKSQMNTLKKMGVSQTNLDNVTVTGKVGTVKRNAPMNKSSNRATSVKTVKGSKRSNKF